MFNRENSSSRNSISNQVAEVVDDLPRKDQKEILYFVKLRAARLTSKNFDRKTKLIKGRRPSMAEITQIINKDCRRKNA